MKKIKAILIVITALLLGLTLTQNSLAQEEEPELIWTGSYNAVSGMRIYGHALVQMGNAWTKVYEGEYYIMQSNGHVNVYEGNNLGLDAEYERVLSEHESIPVFPELTWTGGYDANSGTRIYGHAIIQMGNTWVRVYAGEAYVMESNGHVNTYIGNAEGLNNEYERILSEHESIPVFPELTWTGGYGASEGDDIWGHALIDFGDNNWVKVPAGTLYIMPSDGYVHTYNGNQAGLNEEYDRLLGFVNLSLP